MDEIDEATVESRNQKGPENAKIQSLDMRRSIGKLAASAPMLGAVAQLRLEGFTLDEIAESLELPKGSMSRLWKECKVFLASELSSRCSNHP